MENHYNDYEKELKKIIEEFNENIKSITTPKKNNNAQKNKK